MISIIEFIINVLGLPDSSDVLFIYYVVAALILMILIDGIITFILSGITSLTMRGK